jgi:hypothetical protein
MKLPRRTFLHLAAGAAAWDRHRQCIALSGRRRGVQAWPLGAVLGYIGEAGVALIWEAAQCPEAF